MKTTIQELGLTATVIVGSMSALTARALAVDKTWVDNSNQNWPSTSNWSPIGEPGTTDTAIFNLGNVTPPYLVLFVTAQFQAINAVVDKLRIDSNPITFTIPASTLTIDSTNITETQRGLIIGRVGSGTPNAALDNLLLQLNTVYATFGVDAGSNGTLNVNGGTFNVTGVGAVWDLILGRNGAGTININSGADVAVADDTVLGLNAGSTGNVNVSGAGSTWTSAGDLAIGGAGDGTLTVSVAATATSANGYLGNSAGSNGVATITGAGTAWNGLTGLYVGYSGDGTLNLTSGGDVIDQFGIVGFNQGSVGEVNVSTGGGSQSRWIHNNQLTVGHSGMGALNITDDGFVQSDTSSIGNTSTGNGTVTVSGAGSYWTTLGEVFVGVLGTGSVEISAGGRAVNFDTFIGWNPGSTGEATVTGTGSEWVISASDLYVGNAGDGSLLMSDQAQVNCASAVLGTLPGSSAHMDVEGSGTYLLADGPLVVANQGQATLNITTGARVDCSIAHIGYLAGATGQINVSGGTLDVDPSGIGGSLYVGSAGEGLLRLNGGSVVCEDLILSGLGTIEMTGGSLSLRHSEGPLGTNWGGDLYVNGGAINVSGGTLYAEWESIIQNSGSINVSGAGVWQYENLVRQFSGAIHISNGGHVRAMPRSGEDADAFVATVVIDGSGSIWDANFNGMFVGTGTGPGSMTVINGGELEAPLTLGALGTLRGDGVVDGPVISNGGLVSPGNPVGPLTLLGDYSSNANSHLVIDLLSPSSHGQLLVSGEATLAGTLTVNLIDGFEPRPGATFTIITSPDVSLAFATVNVPPGMQVIYNPTSVILQMAGTPCPADIAPTGAPDGVVNVDDLLAVINTWGSCANPNNCPADIAPPGGNDVVNVDDLLAVINAWGPCPN